MPTYPLPAIEAHPHAGRAVAPTPSQTLMLNKYDVALTEGYDPGTAVVRVAHQLGVSRTSVLKAWVQYRAQEEITE